MASSSETTTEDDFWDSGSAILIWDSLRARKVPGLAAAIMTGAVLVADAVRSLKAGS